MKVARQFTAWLRKEKRPVPAGRYDWLLAGVLRSRAVCNQRSESDRPSGTEYFFIARSRHFVPGYLHMVPPGQKKTCGFQQCASVCAREFRAAMRSF